MSKTHEFMTFNKISAILSLRPDAKWECLGDELTWHDKEQIEPTQAEIDTEIIRLEAEWTAQEYARNRKAEYPDMGTQFNKIYDDGIDAWKTDMVDPIKAKYPKP